MSNRRALVTGAGGFVGSEMARLLKEKKWCVIGTDMRPPKEKESAFFHFLPADLRAKNDMKRLFEKRVDVVFHCADILDTLAPRGELEAAGEEAMRNLCTFALEREVSRVIVLSSASVYGRNSFHRKKIEEVVHIQPACESEKAMLRVEQIGFRFFSHFDLPVTILRPTDVYGRGGRSGVGNLLSELSRLHIVPVSIGFQAAFSLVHVRDLSRAAYFLSQDPVAAGEIYNVAEDTSLTLSELFSFAGDLFEKKKVPVFVPQPWVVDCVALFSMLSDFMARKTTLEPIIDSKISRYLCRNGYYSNEKLKERGFRFLYPDSRKGIEEMIEWYREQGWMGKESVQYKRRAVSIS